MTKIGVIGSGSWATAVVSLLETYGNDLFWWVRDRRFVSFISRYKRNPHYLSSLELHIPPANISSDIRQVIQQSNIVFTVVPSVFLKQTLEDLSPEDFEGKIIVSCTKGLIPDDNQTVSEFFQTRFKVPFSQFVFLTGPSHAEEVARKKLTYLTLASKNKDAAKQIAQLITEPAIRIRMTDGVCGLEYASVLKNIYAISAGICHAVGYGDNFLAVLVSNAIREMNRFLISHCNNTSKKIMNSGYLGDLLVTAFSQLSRNRMFGTMIGHGYSPKAAILEMNMVPEGYYSIKSFYTIIKKNRTHMPIVKAVYNILYQNSDPLSEMKNLEKHLN